jgi:hypothetical protein
MTTMEGDVAAAAEAAQREAFAKTERIRLKATFFNNMAVGLGISGFLVPAVTLFSTELSYGQIGTSRLTFTVL